MNSVSSPLRTTRRGRFTIRALLQALALALLLVACTGTEEERLPTLLVVGSQSETGGELRLLEDIYDPTASPSRTLEPVAGSRRQLNAPPVSLDVVDALGNRSELVVLSVGEGVSELRFFDIAAVDPGTGQGFEESRQAIDLNALFAAAGHANETACLAQVSVSGGVGGQPLRAALYDDGSCGNDFAEVFVVDVEDRSLVGSPLVADLAEAGIYLDDQTDRVYFARDDIGATAVEYLELPDGDEGHTGRANLNDLDLRDLVPVAAGIALLENGEFAVVPLQADEDDAATAVSTISDAESIMADPYGVLMELVVIGRTRTAIHVDSQDDDPYIMQRVSGVRSATIEPVSRFAYLLAEDGVYILDMIRREDSPDPYGSFFVELEDQGEPLVVEWIFAAQSQLP